jgi:multicomponent Na+:H+ antiporter subunit F
MNDVIYYVVFSFVGIGALFALFRLVKGPKIADRAVSLDTFNVIVIGVIALLSMLFDNELFLDIAIIYGILAFLETIVFARYLEANNDSD